MTDALGNVALATREVVIEANHFLTSLHQPVRQVGANKAGSASDQVTPEVNKQVKILRSNTREQLSGKPSRSKTMHPCEEPSPGGPRNDRADNKKYGEGKDKLPTKKAFDSQRLDLYKIYHY